MPPAPLTHTVQTAGSMPAGEESGGGESAAGGPHCHSTDSRQLASRRERRRGRPCLAHPELVPLAQRLHLGVDRLEQVGLVEHLHVLAQLGAAQRLACGAGRGAARRASGAGRTAVLCAARRLRRVGAAGAGLEGRACRGPSATPPPIDFSCPLVRTGQPAAAEACLARVVRTQEQAGTTSRGARCPPGTARPPRPARTWLAVQAGKEVLRCGDALPHRQPAGAHLAAREAARGQVARRRACAAGRQACVAMSRPAASLTVLG